MLSFFKRRSVPESLNFKARVESFWDWYAKVASRFYQTIEDKRCTDLTGEVSKKVDELLPGFAWVFGPGENGGHSFTLSGEGVLHKQLLTQYWAGRAPALAGWTFYSARQPGRIDGIRMNIERQSFDPMEFWLTPAVDPEEEKVDITAWHPLYQKLSEQNRLGPLFLFLDEALGEYGTGQWIGEIEASDRRLTDAIPLGELPTFIEKLAKETGWKKLPPGEGVSLYEFNRPDATFPRGDLVVGTTMNMQLINEYLASEGDMEDPLAGTGAHYVFVSFDAGILPEGKQVDARAAIEDGLDAALRAAASGRLMGGGLGREFAYVDLLLLDGKNSLSIVQRVLREHQLPPGTAINFFAKESKGHRVVL